MSRRRAATAGFTLAEMLVTTAVVAVAAGVAIPSASPVAEVRLDAVASEAVAALRFARAEAMRVGDYRAVSCNAVSNQLQVYGPDRNPDGTLKSSTPVQIRTFMLSAIPAGNNVDLTACRFTFPKAGTGTWIAFDPSGNPVYTDGSTVDVTQSLTSGSVELSAGSVQRTVSVAPTGRVTAS